MPQGSSKWQTGRHDTSRWSPFFAASLLRCLLDVFWSVGGREPISGFGVGDLAAHSDFLKDSQVPLQDAVLGAILNMEETAVYKQEHVKKYSWVLDATPHMEPVAKAAGIGALLPLCRCHLMRCVCVQQQSNDCCCESADLDQLQVDAQLPQGLPEDFQKWLSDAVQMCLAVERLGDLEAQEAAAEKKRECCLGLLVLHGEVLR